MIGKTIQLPAMPGMGLDALDYTLPAGTTTRRVRVYSVPAAVSADRYFISITDIGGIETVPPSRSRDTQRLADFSLDANDNATTHFIHPSYRG